jgi:hypothetical protein
MESSFGLDTSDLSRTKQSNVEEEKALIVKGGKFKTKTKYELEEALLEQRRHSQPL